MIPIIVMNDGETWSGVNGCSLCMITPEQYDRLCEGEEPSNIHPVTEIYLKEMTNG
mgnify:FL=1